MTAPRMLENVCVWGWHERYFRDITPHAMFWGKFALEYNYGNATSYAGALYRHVPPTIKNMRIAQCPVEQA